MSRETLAIFNDSRCFSSDRKKGLLIVINIELFYRMLSRQRSRCGQIIIERQGRLRLPVRWDIKNKGRG